MSGLRPAEMDQFYRRLHARDMDTTKLAALAGRSRAVVTKILNGSTRRGPAWPRIRAHLRPEEIALLDVAQSSTWNKKRVEKRPVWTPEKEAALRA